MHLQVLTLFPELISSPLQVGLLGKAFERGVVTLDVVNPREFTTDRHRMVDDVPYGGGHGMVLKPEPLVTAIEEAKRRGGEKGGAQRVVLLTPQGERFTQAKARELSKVDVLTFVCGKYEGFDERIRHWVDDEVSVGDFVLTGGEFAALVIVDSVVRLLPGVLGNEASPEEESFSEGLLEYPQYTRPRAFRGMEVPEVLLSGDHGRIRRWRRRESLLRTRERRGDLWGGLSLSDEDARLLSEDE